MLATWYEELIHWKRPWCWERLKAGGEGDDRGWDGWMASPTQWTWVWEDSGSWWWIGRPGVLQSMGSQRVGHGWETELNHGSGLTQGYFILIFPFPRREPVGLRLLLAGCRWNGDGYPDDEAPLHPWWLPLSLPQPSSLQPWALLILTNMSHVGWGCGSIIII